MAQPVPRQQTYVPAVPVAGPVQTSQSTCGFNVSEHQGAWLWTCERVNSQGAPENLRVCKLVRTNGNIADARPVTCKEEWRNYLEKVEEAPAKQVSPGVWVRELTPYVRSIGTRKEEVSKTSIPVRRSAGTTSEKDSRMAGKVDLPTKAEDDVLLQQQPVLTEEDFKRGLLGIPSGMLLYPETQDIKELLASMQTAAGNGEIRFLTYDGSYGVQVDEKGMPRPFKFSPRHMSLEQLSRERLQPHIQYIEWLVSVSWRLRKSFPEQQTTLYDPATQTIALLEDTILIALGRLEAGRKYFRRPAIFDGYQAHSAVMHPVLWEYAARPPQVVWMSPLPLRYIPPGAGKSLGVEEQKFYDWMKIVLKLIRDVPEFTTFYDSDMLSAMLQVYEANPSVVAALEDTILAILARLQFQHGRAFPTGILRRNGSEFTGSMRRFATPELTAYIDHFALRDTTRVDATKFLVVTDVAAEQLARLGVRAPTVEELLRGPTMSMSVAAQQLATETKTVTTIGVSPPPPPAVETRVRRVWGTPNVTEQTGPAPSPSREVLRLGGGGTRHRQSNKKRQSRSGRR